IDATLELRSGRAVAQSGPPPAPGRTQGQERFKALVSDLRLYLEDWEPQLRRLESELPWHVLHGEGSPARAALIEKLRKTMAVEIVAFADEIDAAARGASPAGTKAE